MVASRSQYAIIAYLAHARPGMAALAHRPPARDRYLQVTLNKCHIRPALWLWAPPALSGPMAMGAQSEH
jgi:hypothetical protein